MIAPNELLRRRRIEVFDRTFAVTYALEAVAIVVAMLGAANSLLALVLDRRREIGLIRYLGAAAGAGTADDPDRSGPAGFAGGIAGTGAGDGAFAGPDLRSQQAEFRMDHSVPSTGIAACGALLLVWAVTVLAGVYPARFAARLEPAEVVHEE
jgi:putative ABC transport system permease protein